MDLSWLTIRDLEYLIAVAHHLHFGKAAAACHVSQPALSEQIKKIENSLGFSIFERTSRRVTVTPEGRRVIEQSRVVLEDVEKIAQIGPKGTGLLRGELRLGVIATLGPYYVPHILPPLKKLFPELRLLLHEGITAALVSDLRDGNLDVVLAAAGTFRETGLRVLPLFEEPFLLAIPRKHPLATKTPLLATDLRAADMVLLEDGHCLRDQAVQLCARNRRGNIRQYFATSVETLRHLVAGGAGYTLMPALAVARQSPMKKLVLYRSFHGTVGRTIVAVCRESSPRIKEWEQLAAFLKEQRPEGLKSA